MLTESFVFRSPFAFFSLICLGTLAAACSDAYVDDDHKLRFARQVIPDMAIQDSIDVDLGDRTDFKRVTPMFDGTVTLKVTVGDPFEGKHGLTGEMGVYTTAPKLLVKKPVFPSTARYELSFEAEAHTSYVFRIEGVSGKAIYQVDFSQTIAPKDPCANVSCQSGQRCEEGTCVAVGGSEPSEPSEPESTTTCPDGCKRGFYCSKKKKRCVKRACFGVKCKSGFYCSGGKCRPKAVKPKGCSPKCKNGFTCKGRKCVKTGGGGGGDVSSVDKTKGPIGARVLQVSPSGATCIVTLSRGKKHHVKKGHKGTVGGFSMKIIEVYLKRSRARVNAPHSKVSAIRKARIIRR